MTRPKESLPEKVVVAPAIVVAPPTESKESHVAEIETKKTKALADVETHSLTAAGQRKINLIWEVTQSVIALMSVGGGVFILTYQAVVTKEQSDLPTTLSSMIFLVLGFYFARTNHEKVGGVGAKTEQPYEGR